MAKKKTQTTPTPAATSSSSPQSSESRPAVPARPTPVMLQEKLTEAYQSGQYMVAVWSIRDGRVHLYRQTSLFPTADFPVAVELLEKDLGSENTGPIPA